MTSAVVVSIDELDVITTEPKRFEAALRRLCKQYAGTQFHYTWQSFGSPYGHFLQTYAATLPPDLRAALAQWWAQHNRARRVTKAVS